MGTGEDYRGIVNLIENKAYFIHDEGKNDEPADIPADMTDMVEEYRLTLIETAAEEMMNCLKNTLKKELFHLTKYGRGCRKVSVTIKLYLYFAEAL